MGSLVKQLRRVRERHNLRPRLWVPFTYELMRRYRSEFGGCVTRSTEERALIRVPRCDEWRHE